MDRDAFLAGKADELAHYRSDVEMDLMRRIKAGFDPKGIMNPGKMVGGD